MPAAARCRRVHGEILGKATIVGVALVRVAPGGRQVDAARPVSAERCGESREVALLRPGPSAPPSQPWRPRSAEGDDAAAWPRH
jgi:hypothetical protein